MNRLDENDDLLDRAARAMADSPDDGEFPEQDILRHVQSVMSSNGHGPRTAPANGHSFRPTRRSAFFARFFDVRPPVRVAASLLVAAVTMAAITWALLQSRPVLAFSVVVRQLHEARTMSANLIVQESSIAMTGKLMFAAPSRFRIEFPGMPAEIADLDAGRVVVIDHPAKTAILMRLDRKDVSPGDDPTAQSLDFIEKLRSISQTAGRSVAEDEINGVPAKEFLVTEQGHECIIWADMKTGAPLRVETTVKIGDRALKLTLDRVALDQPIDDSLFSTAIPKGYSQQEATVSAGPPAEADLVAFFKDYANRNGSYPPSLNDVERTLSPMLEKGSTTMPVGSSAELMRFMLQSGRAVMFLSELPADADWHYAGAKVRSSVADPQPAPLFWYHANSQASWRVIYTDLHSYDVPLDTLPNGDAERQGK